MDVGFQELLAFIVGDIGLLIHAYGVLEISKS